jgi:mRNA interferase MazF
MLKGDIVLIPFPFTDLTGNKKRPALILVPGNMDVTVSFISSQLHWQEETDLLLFPTIANGLKTPSLVRLGKIATVDKSLLIGKLGSIRAKEKKELDRKLIRVFDIDIDL